MDVTNGRSEALSNVDSAWLRMEDPTNLMTITGLMAFEEKLEFAVSAGFSGIQFHDD